MNIFGKPPATPNVEVEGAPKPPEKSQAELIAESIALALKPISDQITAQNERFAKIEDQTKPREVKPVVNPQEPISVLDNEDAAFAQRMTPLFARQLELESRVVKNDIKTEYAVAGYGDLWTQYAGEIDGILDNSPLVDGSGKPQRGDPQYIRNVVDMVLGRAARKAGMRFDGKAKGFFLESASGGEHTNNPTPDGMSDNQRKIMTRMGIPLDKAKAVMGKLQFVQ